MPTSGKLLVSIVERGRGERIVSLTRSAGAQGGSILPGRGTATSSLLQILGLGSAEKDIILTLTPPAVLAPIIDALQGDDFVRGKIRGVAFVVDVDAIFQHPLPPIETTVPKPSPAGEKAMPTHELISVIVNAGYAEDVMHTARKAGAGGGTILKARGTGTEDDVKFFGITIVPEKEFLMILAEKEQAPAILEAIRSTPCLSERGAGIAFCIGVENFLPLGGGRPG